MGWLAIFLGAHGLGSLKKHVHCYYTPNSPINEGISFLFFIISIFSNVAACFHYCREINIDITATKHVISTHGFHFSSLQIAKISLVFLCLSLQLTSW
ncbi:hypothetical protein O9992_10385 [Vibrio lentus]|nr:hypothetical protein [Vibrio lentus]